MYFSDHDCDDDDHDLDEYDDHYHDGNDYAKEKNISDNWIQAI